MLYVLFFKKKFGKGQESIRHVSGSGADTAQPGDPGGALVSHQFQSFLRDMPMCAELQDCDVKELVGECHVETFAPRQVVCREGERDHRLLIILSGSLVVQNASIPTLSSAVSASNPFNSLEPVETDAPELYAGCLLGIFVCL